MYEIINRHKTYSVTVLDRFIREVSRIEALKNSDNFCIFASGAFGRLEASSSSGIDLFFIAPGNTNTRISTADEIRINAGLIEIVNALKLSSFCGSDAYIHTLYIEDMLHKLATPQDITEGLFEPRMLFLLESVPVYGNESYEAAAKKIIVSYFEDYPEYTKDFPAVFLVNDIIRYWKTTLLDNEHQRVFRLTNSKWKPWLDLENLKLIFSKKLACYSFIIQIIAKRDALTTDAVFEIVRMKPVERLLKLAKEQKDVQPLVNEIVDMYGWAMALYEEEDAFLTYIKDKKNRKEAFNKGRFDFTQKLSDLIAALAKDDTGFLKYLII